MTNVLITWQVKNENSMPDLPSVASESTCPIWIAQWYRANGHERYAHEFKSHQVRGFSYGSGHSADIAANSIELDQRAIL